MKSPLKTALAATIVALCLVAGAQAEGMKACGRVSDHRTGNPWFVTANHNTSCALARSVTHDAQYTLYPTSYSPLTGRYYRFQCYRSGHAYYYNRYTCISYDGLDGPLRVVMRG